MKTKKQTGCHKFLCVWQVRIVHVYLAGIHLGYYAGRLGYIPVKTPLMLCFLSIYPYRTFSVQTVFALVSMHKKGQRQWQSEREGEARDAIIKFQELQIVELIKLLQQRQQQQQQLQQQLQQHHICDANCKEYMLMRTLPLTERVSVGKPQNFTIGKT